MRSTHRSSSSVERILTLILVGLIAVSVLLVVPSYASELKLDRLHPSLPVVKLRPLAEGRARIADGLGKDLNEPVQRLAGQLQQAGAKALNPVIPERDKPSADPSKPSPGSSDQSSTGSSPPGDPTATHAPTSAPTATFMPLPTSTPFPTVTNTKSPSQTPTWTPVPPSSTPVPDGIFYVATSGSDSAPGTSAQPWRTIQHAVDSVGPGDKIHVRAGTYNESIHVSQSGSQGNPIVLANYAGETVAIDGGAGPAIADFTGTQYWILEGLTLDSDADFTIELNAWGCDGTCRGTHHWQVRNNRIIGAVHIYGSYNLLEGNEIDGSQHKGSENGLWELYDVSHHNIFRNNHIHHFNTRGIWSMRRTHDTIIENNYIHHIGNDSQGMCIDTDGFSTVEWRHVIRDNFLHDCGTVGIELENTYDALVENNIILKAGRIGIHIINYGPGVGPGGEKCQAGGENGQYGDTDGDNNCKGDLTGNMIRQNLIYDGAQEGAITVHYAGDVEIFANSIANVSGYGLVLHGGVALCPEIVLRSNIIAYTSKPSISIEDSASLVIDDHNLVYRAESDEVYEIRSNSERSSLVEYQSSANKGEGSYQEPPEFVEVHAANLHLKDTSPAIDTGVNTGLAIDLDGNPRPRGGGYDIGAYESPAYRQVTTSTPLPSPTSKSTATEQPPSAQTATAQQIPEPSADSEPESYRPPSVAQPSNLTPAPSTEDSRAATTETSTYPRQSSPTSGLGTTMLAAAKELLASVMEWLRNATELLLRSLRDFRGQ